MIMSHRILLRVRNLSDKNFRKITTYYLWRMAPPSSRKLCHVWDNVEKFGIARQATDDDTAHAHFILNNEGYKHALRICNASCISMANTLMQTRFNVTFIYIYIYTLPVFFRFWWAVNSHGRIPVGVRFLQKLWQWGRLRMEKSCSQAESCTMVLWPLARWAYVVTIISGPKLNHQV
jgi:hypothetical protein